ncbi:MAG: hypothetical protein ACXVGQ_00115 [Mycobacteriaceae bacterium]
MTNMGWEPQYGWQHPHHPHHNNPAPPPHHGNGGGQTPGTHPPDQGGGAGGTGGGPSTPPPVNTPPSTADPGNMFNQSAYDAMMLLLDQYGLGDLAGTLKDLIKNGITDSASIQLALQQTDAWKKRFAGNEILRKKGLPVLSVGEYLSVERSYAQILNNYGLPKGFYDGPEDFAKFIGNSVSANELQQRAQIYSDISKRDTDPAVLAQLKALGLSEGDILAHTMDPTRAMPLLQRKYQQVILGAAARRAGSETDNKYLGHLADIGVSEQQAAQGYGTIAENLATMQTLGNVYHDKYTQRDFENEVFDQSGTAANKRKRLASQERASFSGSSGVGQGSLVKRTGGSY